MWLALDQLYSVHILSEHRKDNNVTLLDINITAVFFDARFFNTSCSGASMDFIK